ncbi:fungal specific transcription factor domain-containing protein [Phlyctema vagabunda]|uniref:Fungal specific transcription factor domain-containing protein n=1 Tax=Phlyctema vagabunda TaxID=108571 RepID=A0ABR4P4Y3_9HELO
MDHDHDKSQSPDDSRSPTHSRTNSEALTTSAKHKACDTCKRRKIRCSGSSPCHHCQRNDAPCHYTSSRGKLAIVERRLAKSQRRVELLEKAFKKFVPHIDLSYALHSIETGISPENATDGRIAAAGSGNVDTSNQLDIATPLLPVEYDLEKADTLEWDESSNVESLADGIGSLSVDPKGFGYMGPQSGNALLRYLQSIANFFPVDDGTRLWDDNIKSPKLTGPPDRSASQYCIDWYFKHFHPAYPILHEGFFRAQVMGAIPKPKDGSWPLLLNTVLAIGAFAGPESSKHTDDYFFEKARESLSVNLLRRGTLPLVQAFALLANYLQKRGMPNTGFTFLGIATHMALGIGLHREFSQESLSAFTMEVRRRVWWTLYIFDSGSRLTFGRPSMLLGGVNIQRPSNLHDYDLSVDNDKLAPPNNHPTVVSSLIWQSNLADISNTVNAKLLERRLPDENIILSLDTRVQSWWQDLPSYFHEDSSGTEQSWFEIPRMVLLWRSWHLRIVMTRPFLLNVVRNRRPLDVSNSDKAVARCIHSAQECVLSITMCYNRDQTLPGALVWYATYWLVTAVFVLVTCLVYDPYHSLSFDWRQQVGNAKLALESMAHIEPLAKRAAVILEKIIGLVPQSPDSTLFTYNEPTRMGIADIWAQSWLNPLPDDQNLPALEQMQLPAWDNSHFLDGPDTS